MDSVGQGAGDDAAGVSDAVAEAGAQATLAAWRERGADRRDPVRFRFLEALARRAAAQHGEARRLLDDRLAALLSAYGAALSEAEAEAASAPRDAGPPLAAPLRGPLAELLDHLARHVAPEGETGAAGDSSRTTDAATELKTLSRFRSTWSRLATDQRLMQSRALVPQKAGPLNSHHLVHRSLALMRELSPAYLARFVSYVDALLWLEQAGAASPSPAVPPASGGVKTSRGRVA